jgi:hypothetical protein
MAIAAVHLNRATGTLQIMTQMNRVVQLDRSGVRIAEAHCGELGVPAVEAGNVMHELGRRAVAMQVRVTLRAVVIPSGRETQMTAMLLMARRTIRLKGLICVMNRPIVA